ncbi:hypothetical protein DK750_06880 [Salmonella enterica subsp. enterica serovar Rovaniemi]|nr:hypothetical protein [Salmonella enterica subsp. enterica serovar Rovaniemi]
MPIENATVISELNPDWPVGASDFVSQGDDQLRMMKKVLQNTLPNATAPITGTPDKLNNLTGGLNFVEGGDEIQPYWQLANPDGGSAVVLATAPMTLEAIKSGGEFALTLTTLHDVIFAVGSQYVNYIDSRNPVDILGFGTWEPIVGLIAGAGSATDCQGYVQNYSAGYQPGFWRVQNFHVVHTEYDVSLTMDPVDPHTHGEGEINSFYNDSGHTATVPGDGAGSTGSAGGHTPTGTGHLTIGEGTPTDSTAFFNPYYGAYIWTRTA